MQISAVRKQSGFSLVELMVTVGILSVIAVGTSVQLLGQFRDQQKMQSKLNMVQTGTLINKVFGKTSTNAASCAASLQAIAPFNTANGSINNVQVFLPGDDTNDQTKALKAGSKVPGPSQFTVNKIYLGDTVQLPSRANSYLTSLYMVADVGALDLLMRTKPRALATVVVTINPTTQKIAECNVSTQMPDAQQACNGLYGMRWNQQTGNCDQDLALDTNFQLTECPAGTQPIGGVCLPTPSGCANGQIATGFDRGITQNCSQPPLNPAVGVPTNPVPPPVAGVQDQTPQPVSNPGNYSGGVTSGTIAPPAAATPPPLCSNGTSMEASNYDQCNSSSACRPMLSGITRVDAATCTGRSTASYVPPTTAVTPSNAPPNDGSCQCNRARIADGDYCVYCIRDINIGYRYVDYAYGINKCVNGNLQPDDTAVVDTSQCSGGYAPARVINGGVRQLPGYQIQ